MFCEFGQKVKVMDLETGKMKCAIGQVSTVESAYKNLVGTCITVFL